MSDTAADLHKELAHIVRWYDGDIVYIIKRVRKLEVAYSLLREAALHVVEIERLIGGADESGKSELSLSRLSQLLDVIGFDVELRLVPKAKEKRGGAGSGCRWSTGTAYAKAARGRRTGS